MTITTVDQVVSALGNNSSRLVIDKASVANATSSLPFSLWRATGQPGVGAIPTTAAVCDHNLVGAMPFTQQTAPATSYGAWANMACGNAAVPVEIHDRLMHMGGLSGTVTTAQTVNLDLNANLASANLDARKGGANFSDVQWWLEWYTATGATGVTATVAVTYNDGTSGNLSGIALAATRREAFLVSLNQYVPAASAGKYIRDVDSVTLSASTGTAGNFGVTATRPRLVMPTATPNKAEVFDWAALGLPEIYNSSCLALIVYATTTTTGTVRGGAKIAHG